MTVRAMVMWLDAPLTVTPELDALASSIVKLETSASVTPSKVTALPAPAASMVVAEMAMPSLEPVDVTVNRPFIFLIRDRETGALLFVGRVVNPAE